MKFYKLHDVISGEDVYTTPSAIEYYIHHEDRVEIHLKSSDYFNVNKFDFTTMFIMEGVDEFQ